MKVVRSLSIATLVIILLLLLSVPAFAADSVGFTVGAIEATPGETITMPISITNNSGFVSASLMVNFDSAVLELTEVVDAGLVAGAMHTTTYSSPFYFTWENDRNTNDCTSKGKLVELVFKVSDYATEGDFSIEVAVPTDGLLNCNGQEVATSSIPGKVVIKTKECEHIWSQWKTMGTSKHKRMCTLCNEIEYGRHTWDDGTIIKQPTTETAGVREYTCEMCLCSKTEPISPKECEHVWSNWIKYNEYKHMSGCKNCAEDMYEDHNWNSGEVTEEPTEDEVGIKVYTCEICSGTKSEIIPALSDGAEDDGELTVSATGKKISGGASVTLELSNTGKDAENCRIAVAAFNSTGRMLDVEIANLTVNGEASLSKTLSLTTSETISKVKLFYLDDRWVPAGDVQLVALK